MKNLFHKFSLQTLLHFENTKHYMQWIATVTELLLDITFLGRVSDHSLSTTTQDIKLFLTFQDSWKRSPEA